MTKEAARVKAVRYWWQMAGEALQSARIAFGAGHLHTAMNRAYYAVFYAATAALVARSLQFKRHGGVRSALHREFIKTGLLPAEMGPVYDRLFEDRQHGDYMALIEFESDYVQEKIESAAAFIIAIQPLIPSLEEK